MGVRVKIRVKLNREEVETAALVNTGFETEQPEILLPVKLAERLGLYPPARNSTLEEYDVVGGITLVIKSSRLIDVQVLVEDRNTSFVKATPIISSEEGEVLISDKLASALKLSIEDPGGGLWRFNDEPLSIKRPSVLPEYWK